MDDINVISEGIITNASITDAIETISKEDASLKITLGKFVRIAMGSDTLDNFALRTTLSKSYLSKLMNGKFTGKPKISSLKKIADASNGTVPLNNLLKAAGYEQDLSEISAIEFPSQNLYNKLNSILPRVPLPEFPTGTASSIIQNDLIKKGISNIIFNIPENYPKGCFNILYTDNNTTVNIIGIPCFYSSISKVNALNETATSILKIMTIFPQDTHLFYFVTGNIDLYGSLIENFDFLNAVVIYSQDNLSVTEMKVLPERKEDNK